MSSFLDRLRNLVRNRARPLVLPKQLRLTRHYHVRAGQLGLAVALATIVGAVGFQIILRGQFRDLAHAYRSANVFLDIAAEDPSVPIGGSDARHPTEGPLGERSLTPAILAQIIKIAGLSDEPVSAAVLADPQGQYFIVYDAIFGKRRALSLRSDSLRTIDLLVHLTQVGGAAASGDSSAAAVRELNVRLLGAAMANPPVGLFGPFLADEYSHAASSRSFADATPDVFDHVMDHADGTPSVTGLLWPMSHNRPTEAALLKTLFITTKVLRADGFAYSGGTPQQNAFVSQFAAMLVSRLYSSPQVKPAAEAIKILYGPEQLVLCIVFALLLILFVLREISRMGEEHALGVLTRALRPVRDDKISPRSKALRDALAAADQDRLFPDSTSSYAFQAMVGENPERRNMDVGTVHELCALEKNRIVHSRWPVRWGARALPAIGFIGTTRGILLALASADAIVRAASQAGQAAAISEISGFLGLSFATTLVGLVFSLIILLLNDYQMSRELELVDRLEQTLLPLAEPPGVDTTYSLPLHGHAQADA